MPITFELREDNHVIYSVVSEPLNVEELNDSVGGQLPVYDDSPYKVHQLVNVIGVTHLPSGILGVRRDSPTFQHPNRGQLVIVGAHGFVRNVADILMKIAHFDSVKFFKDESEGWEYLRKVIADETHN